LEKGDDRQIEAFESDTQEESIEQGKAFLEVAESQIDRWAFAREGQIEIKDEPCDVLTLQAKSTDGELVLTILQKFQPKSSGEFKVIGSPDFFTNRNRELIVKPVPQTEKKLFQFRLNKGIESHIKSKPHRAAWGLKV
jgi:hypothetical protein